MLPKHSHPTNTAELAKHLVKPSDFITTALDKGAAVSAGHGSRVVVRYNGRAIGFSDPGNKEYCKSYRLLLIRAFKAAGLLILLGVLARYWPS
jgi:hypothetical protein